MPIRARAYLAYALVLAAGAAIFANAALAEGTAADAKAMLDKTIAALKADKAKTLDEINAAHKWLPARRHISVLLQSERRPSRRRRQSQREGEFGKGHQVE